MPYETWSQSIAAAVVPAVTLSGCSLLCSAFYNRLTAILGRLRALTKEMLHDQDILLSRSGKGDTQLVVQNRARRTVAARRVQADQLLRRAALMRGAARAVLVCIACLVTSSVATGAGVLFPAALAVGVAAFGAALLSLLVGVSLALRELRLALVSVEAEHALACELADELESPPKPRTP